MQINILSHNVYWFQGVPFEGTNPGDANETILNGLASYYICHIENLDLAFFQEIQSENTSASINSKLGLNGIYCPGKTLTPYGGSAGWSSDLQADVLSQSIANDTQRMYQVIRFTKAGQTLTVANVHLPSTRQLSTDEATEKRIQEIETVLQSFPDQVDIILGDFNENPGGPLSDYLKAMGYEEVATITDQKEKPTTIGDNRGDMIWVKASLGSNVKSYDVIADKQSFSAEPEKQFLSDHFPLLLTLEI